MRAAQLQVRIPYPSVRRVKSGPCNKDDIIVSSTNRGRYHIRRIVIYSELGVPSPKHGGKKRRNVLENFKLYIHVTEDDDDDDVSRHLKYFL